MKVFVLIVLAAFISVAVCCLMTGIYRLFEFLRTKKLHLPKTFKLLLKIMLGVVIAAVIGYFVFTGCQV